MKFSTPTLLASLTLALPVGACHHDKPATTTTTTSSPTMSADGSTYQFQVGTLQCVALKDGSLQPPNDAKIIGVGKTPQEIGDVLAAAGASRDTLDLSIQPLLVRDGEHTLLFDTGAAGMAFVKDGGQLATSLVTAGATADQITDIFISHSHGDHIGGLVKADGTLAFPNAKIHLDKAEWALLQSTADDAKIVAAITPQVDAFEPGAQLLPEVTAVETHGHTPGHSSYLITSGADSLFYTGDVVHSSIISVQRPDWSVAFDMDDAQARKTRAEMLKHLADANLHVYAVHFPFPGVGHVKAQGDAYVWVPDAK